MNIKLNRDLWERNSSEIEYCFFLIDINLPTRKQYLLSYILKANRFRERMATLKMNECVCLFGIFSQQNLRELRGIWEM